MKTLRQNRPDVSITVDPLLVQIAFPEACGQTADLEDLQLGIRRVGDHEDMFVLGYNTFGRDDHNRVAFRLDADLHRLDAGYYDAVLLQDCEECGVIRLDMTKRRALKPSEVAITKYTECPPPGGQLPGTGYTDMFEPYIDWSAKTTCMLDRVETTIKVDAQLPTPLPSVPPQLVLRDGVAVEIVDVVTCTPTSITVKRGNPSYKFPVGACIQFEWTEANILAVANQNCPTTTDTGTDTSTDNTEQAILEAGKGIVLNTSEDGKIIVELAATDVVPGVYGGLTVDDCGRVAMVDANFPAAGLPVFDACCKDEDDAP